MRLKDIAGELQTIYNPKLAEDWDNVGLLVGNENTDINTILLCLDITEEVVDRAVKENADLIISHHPFIFSGLKKITSETVHGRKILKLIENKIAVYSGHTNVDFGINGLNDYIFYKLDLNGKVEIYEINRAPAKVQSALLEAMQERQVTIGDSTFKLDTPFMVMATQNPVEQEGTYPLPEAQVDRFMLKTVIDYPKLDEEQQIMRDNLSNSYAVVNQTVSLEQILKAQEAVREVYMDEKIEKYILDIIFATRYPEKYNLAELKPLISFGASPRGSINLAMAAKCYAFIKRRGYVIPEDVRAVVFDVLRHRIGITYEAEAENITSVEMIHKIVNTIEVP